METAFDEAATDVGLTLEVAVPEHCPLRDFDGDIISANRHIVDGECRSEFVVRSEETETQVSHPRAETEPDSCFCHVFYEYGTIPTFDSIDEGRLTVSFHLEDEALARSLFSDVKGVCPDVDVISIDPNQSTHPYGDRVSVRVGDLTAKQREAMETAVQRGYYGHPQDVDLETLADELDVSRQALAKRLHKAEEKVLGNLFSNGNPPDPCGTD
ncbi:MAG: helix-turn-helix domain-containing protein [Halodesulfurarchaeum sp.]